MKNPPLNSAWNDDEAQILDGPSLLLYRSNLLGRDARISNFGGGNTSAKLMMKEPLTGRLVKVLWVKSSDDTLGATSLDGFATLYTDKLAVLHSHYKKIDQDDLAARDLSHCVFNLNPQAPSVDAFLHGFVPHDHVDQIQTDSLSCVASAKNSEQLTKDIFGGEIAYVPWQRPGIDLAKKIGKLAEDNPKLAGIIIGNQGLLTWGETSKACYETTLRILNTLDRWLGNLPTKPAFGGESQKALGPDERKVVALRLLPEIRGCISSQEMKLAHFSDAPEVS